MALVQVADIVKPPAREPPRDLPGGPQPGHRKRCQKRSLFTPRHDTVIVAALAGLKNARGRDVFLEAILSTQDEVGANFFMNMAQTLQGYNETVSPIQHIALVNGLTVARAKNGRALIPFPLDRGVWSERGNKILSHLKQNYQAAGFKGGYDLWVTGTVTSRARQELPALGIAVTENADERIGFLD